MYARDTATAECGLARVHSSGGVADTWSCVGRGVACGAQYLEHWRTGHSGAKIGNSDMGSVHIFASEVFHRTWTLMARPGRTALQFSSALR